MDNLREHLPVGPDGKSIDFNQIDQDLNQYNEGFHRVHLRYIENFSKRVRSVPKFDEFSQLKQLQNSSKLLPFISKMKSEDLRETIIEEINKSQNNKNRFKHAGSGSFKVSEDPYNLGLANANSQIQFDHQ